METKKEIGKSRGYNFRVKYYTFTLKRIELKGE